MVKKVLWFGFLFISHDDMSQGVNLGQKHVSLAKAQEVLGNVGQQQGDQIGWNFAFKDTGIFGGEIWFVVGILRT